MVEGPPPGEPLSVRYTLSWGREEAGGEGAELGRVLATHYGAKDDIARYRIDFSVPSGTAAEERPEGVVDVGPGAELERRSVHGNPHTGGWRLNLDVRRRDDSPVQLRAYLSANGTVLTETWDHVDLPAPD